MTKLETHLGKLWIRGSFRLRCQKKTWKLNPLI